MAGQLLTTLGAVEAWLGPGLAPPGTNTTADAKLAALISGCSAAILGHLSRPTMAAQTVTEIRNGTGTPSMFLRRWPVTAVSSLIIGQSAVPAAGAPGSGSVFGYVFDSWDGFPPGRQTRLQLRGLRFPAEPGSVSVTYTAGYSVSGEANEVQEVVAAYQATVAAPYGAWCGDRGVTYANGQPLSPVPASPTEGQYTLGATPGVYLFNAADNAADILISYSFIPAAIGEACCQWVAERYRYQDRVGSRSKTLAGEVVAFDRSPMPPELKPILQPYRNVAPV